KQTFPPRASFPSGARACARRGSAGRSPAPPKQSGRALVPADSCRLGGRAVVVARLDELRVGYATRRDVAGRDVIVTLTEKGVHVWDAVCPHAEFLLEPGQTASQTWTP